MAETRLARLNDLTPDRLRGLSPQLRRAARYVVENPGDVATRSQRQVADAASLPAPTFSRLAQAVGCDSYDQLRDLCRDDLLGSRTVLADRALDLLDRDGGPGDGASLMARHIAATIHNSQTMLGRLDPTQLARISRRLAAAKRVVLIGEMSARCVVEYASYIANMSLTGWKVLGSGTESVSSELAVLNDGDACLVFSFTPYANRSVDLARAVRSTGIPMIAVTDNVLSPMVDLSDEHVLIAKQSPQFFPSQVAATAFFEGLVGMVIRDRGRQAQQQIAAVEQKNHELGEYWHD